MARKKAFVRQVKDKHGTVLGVIVEAYRGEKDVENMVFGPPLTSVAGAFEPVAPQSKASGKKAASAEVRKNRKVERRSVRFQVEGPESTVEDPESPERGNDAQGFVTPSRAAERADPLGSGNSSPLSTPPSRLTPPPLAPGQLSAGQPTGLSPPSPTLASVQASLDGLLARGNQSERATGPETTPARIGSDVDTPQDLSGGEEKAGNEEAANSGDIGTYDRGDGIVDSPSDPQDPIEADDRNQNSPTNPLTKQDLRSRDQKRLEIDGNPALSGAPGDDKVAVYDWGGKTYAVTGREEPELLQNMRWVSRSSSRRRRSVYDRVKGRGEVGRR